MKTLHKLSNLRYFKNALFVNRYFVSVAVSQNVKMIDAVFERKIIKNKIGPNLASITPLTRKSNVIKIERLSRLIFVFSFLPIFPKSYFISDFAHEFELIC